MSKKIKNNFLTTAILAVIVIALAVTISLVQQKTGFLPRAGNLTIESIQNDNQLNSVSDELDKTNFEDFDSVLKQNDSDLSNF